MASYNSQIEKRLWHAADELRANSKLKASEYSMPVLGLIFLRYADHKFSEAERDFSRLAQLEMDLPPEVAAHRRRSDALSQRP